jgi:hypothetical protein
VGAAQAPVNYRPVEDPALRKGEDQAPVRVPAEGAQAPASFPPAEETTWLEEAAPVSFLLAEDRTPA